MYRLWSTLWVDSLNLLGRSYTYYTATLSFKTCFTYMNLTTHSLVLYIAFALLCRLFFHLFFHLFLSFSGAPVMDIKNSEWYQVAFSHTINIINQHCTGRKYLQMTKPKLLRGVALKALFSKLQDHINEVSAPIATREPLWHECSTRAWHLVWNKSRDMCCCNSEKSRSTRSHLRVNELVIPLDLYWLQSVLYLERAWNLGTTCKIYGNGGQYMAPSVMGNIPHTIICIEMATSLLYTYRCNEKTGKTLRTCLLLSFCKEWKHALDIVKWLNNRTPKARAHGSKRSPGPKT
jgi:hypothetical protein